MAKQQKGKPLTPKRALALMVKCSKDWDTEAAHGKGDALLCEIAEQAGFVEAAETFKAMHKWYA